MESANFGEPAKSSPEILTGHNYENDPQFSELLQVWRNAISEEADPDFKRYHRGVEDSKKFKEKHPDFDSYALYHILIGSTPTHKQTMLDTEDGELEKLIRSL